MSGKPLRGRYPINRRIKPPHASLSAYIHRRRWSEKPSKFIKRCKSAPALLTGDLSINGDCATEDHAGLIVQRRACPDVFLSSPDLVLPYSPPKTEGYNKDSKVVVNVTVEGSPGPVRAMVKLGSSVEETIEIVKKKYNSEGRSPQLDQHSFSTFELHPSYFSLQCFDDSNKIGDIGRRSFYMRKRNDSITGHDEIVSSKEDNSPPLNPIFFIVFHSLEKIKRLTSKLSRILGCIDG